MGLNRQLTALGLGSMACFCTSCAAMFGGMKDEVILESNPPGATVIVDGQQFVTPATAKIARKVHTLTIQHPDFAPVDLEWKREMGGGYVLMDILFTPGFGVSGLLIDGLTGAWYDHPAMIRYDFVAQTATPTTVKRTDPSASTKGEPVAASAAAPAP